MIADTDAQTPVRVLIVEDSPTESLIIRRAIESAPDLRVVGCGRNGREGLELLRSLHPDVVCTDYFMPEMDGLGFIRQAMRELPRPILVLSIGVQSYQSDNIFHMLSAGAIDVIAKPPGGILDAQSLPARALQDKIRFLARLDGLHARRDGAADISHGAIPGPIGAHNWTPELFAIGASTGGPQALERILATLPAGFSCPIVCVQHISPGFVDAMASWLNGLSPLQVQLARDGEQPLPGHFYLAPDGANLEMDRHRRFHLAPLNSGHAGPSIDALLRSVADVYGGRAAGVLLSGMGIDGAVGMRAIHYAGGVTIAQDRDSAVVDSMPRAAIESASIDFVLPPERIATQMIRLSSRT